MVKAFSAILHEAGIAPAEYAVLWHVRDTVVQPRETIAGWTALGLRPPSHPAQAEQSRVTDPTRLPSGG